MHADTLAVLQNISGTLPDTHKGAWEMAERKAALHRAPERPRLKDLLAGARSIELTEEQLREQRASFVYGNAPKESGITKESAERSVHRIRIR